MDELRLLQTDNLSERQLGRDELRAAFEELFAELVSMDVGSVDLRLSARSSRPYRHCDLQVRNRRRRRRRWARTSAILSVVGALVIACSCCRARDQARSGTGLPLAAYSVRRPR